MDLLRNIDNSWTLFLDRDGVINFEKENDYIRNAGEFLFYPGVTEALKKLNPLFHKIIVVTNQRGIGKGLMTHDDLEKIHELMSKTIHEQGGRIDGIYYAPELESDAHNRKPNTGMALQAKKDHPTIDFTKSIMVGNNLSDMEFGKKSGMSTVYLRTTKPQQEAHRHIDIFCKNLEDLSTKLLFS